MVRLESPVFKCGKTCARDALRSWVKQQEYLLDTAQQVITGYRLPPDPKECGTVLYEALPCGRSITQQGSIEHQDVSSKIDDDMVFG